MVADDVLAESRRLSELLISSSFLARELFGSIAAELNIPVAVARAVCHLDQPEPMTGLASKLNCDKSYVTPLTDQMESLGLVARTPGPDRRTKMLELTAAGQETRAKLEARIAQLSPVMTNLSSSERETLSVLLAKIAGSTCSNP